jgi:glycosyltransferase involved in cell wall biosynthesis
VSRGAPKHKIATILNSADESVFDVERFPPRGRRPESFVMISHGAIEERYGLDTAIHAVGRLKGDIPGLRLDIYGEGSYRPELERLIGRLGVQRHVRLSEGFVPMGELLQAIAQADVGVVAIKRDAFRDLTHCNKMYEYITMRKPVVLSRARSAEAYFDPSCFGWFTSDDPEDLARAVREVYSQPDKAQHLVRRASQANDPYRWPNQRQLYLRVVEQLLPGASVSSEAGRVEHTSPAGAHAAVLTPIER